MRNQQRTLASLTYVGRVTGFLSVNWHQTRYQHQTRNSLGNQTGVGRVTSAGRVKDAKRVNTRQTHYRAERIPGVGRLFLSLPMYPG